MEIPSQISNDQTIVDNLAVLVVDKHNNIVLDGEDLSVKAEIESQNEEDVTPELDGDDEQKVTKGRAVFPKLAIGSNRGEIRYVVFYVDN